MNPFQKLNQTITSLGINLTNVRSLCTTETGDTHTFLNLELTRLAQARIGSGLDY